MPDTGRLTHTLALTPTAATIADTASLIQTRWGIVLGYGFGGGVALVAVVCMWLATG